MILLQDLISLVSLHDRVGDEGSWDLLAAEPAAVQAIDCSLRGLDGVKLDVDLALSSKTVSSMALHINNDKTNLGLALNLDMLDLAVLLLALGLDVLSEVLIPVTLGLPGWDHVSESTLIAPETRTLQD
jgi:hypothetical protein